MNGFQKTKAGIFLIFLILATRGEASVLSTPRAFSFEVEGFNLWQGRNDAAIPGEGGTRYSLKDFGTSSIPGFRLETSFPILEKSELRAVFAPLMIESSGWATRSISFQGTTFSSGTLTDSVYQFNSYRLTYRYRLIENTNWIVLAGATLKVRDAKIGLQQGWVYKEKTDLGFVPLLHGAVAYLFSPDWHAEIEFDALAAPQGRAEDLRVLLRKQFSPSGISMGLGYRVLEGGADNPEVYTYSLFHYAVFSLGIEI